MKGRVLIVAGSDSGGGAGIQADIKTVTALGGYAMTAVTALTAQNTRGVTAIHEVAADFVAEQMRVVLLDLGADCIKIGMLHRPDVIEAVAAALGEFAANVPLVADPVMVAKGGAALLEDAAVASLREGILPRATVVTPNVPEAEALTGLTIKGEADLAAAAAALAALGPAAVLLKGGHLDSGAEVVDLLRHADGTTETFRHDRIATPHTHGTGCTLASAVATGLAQGMPLHDAVVRARAYVLEAIRKAHGYGTGHGPLDHGHTVGDFG